MNNKKVVYSAFFIALGVLFPMIFHYIGGPGLGRILLPMHLPVLIGAAFLGPLAGLTLGVFTPLLSSLFTGMPPVIPMLPIMVAELAVYGLAMGYLLRKLNIYLALIITMLLGRAAASLVVLLLVYVFSFSQLPANPVIYFYGTVTAGLPGIIGQLIVVPLIVIYLNNYVDNKQVNI